MKRIGGIVPGGSTELDGNLLIPLCPKSKSYSLG